MKSLGKVSSSSYLFLGFLTFLNIMNFVDRQLLASFSAFIVPDLELSNTQFGLLTGLVFLTFYSTAGLFMGLLADTVNRTRLIAVGLACWSLLTAASGAAKGFYSLALPRMFIGVGESVMTPTSMSLLADRFPAQKLGFASGVYYMGVPIGAGASLLVVGYLGPAIGWRNCFYLLGAVGLVLSIVMWTMRETPRRHLINDAAVAVAVPSLSFKEMMTELVVTLRSSSALVMTILGGVAYHFILGAAVFDQLWFVNERGFERAEIAQITGWIGICAGMAGNLFGGIGGDWFQRKTGMGRPMFLFYIMLLLAPISLAFRLVEPDSIWLWAGVTAQYFQLGCFYGPTFATVQDLVPPQIRATSVAFYLLLLNLAGVGIGVTAAGIYVDHLMIQGATAPYTTVLLYFTFASFFAIPLFYFAGRRYDADRKKLHKRMALLVTS
jgi:MFS family permease